jgi:dipeptidyl aminopeptidase/acylaminoacyl peptidase
MKRIIFACALLTLPVVTPAEESKRLSADVLWQLERVAEPIISPNGNHVVVSVTTYPSESEEPDKRLWLLDIDEAPAQRPLTAEGAKASDGAFSPDGSRLAFVSVRGEDEVGQVYVLPMDGPGAATKLTDVPTGAAALKWAGDHIYFISNVWPEKTFE